jgi:hypothetical protein
MGLSFNEEACILAPTDSPELSPRWQGDSLTIDCNGVSSEFHLSG